MTFTDVGEQVFGGDLLTVTTAMQKFVLQIDHHLKDNNEEEKAVKLVHRVNQVWNFITFDWKGKMLVRKTELIKLINAINVHCTVIVCVVKRKVK